MTQVHISGTGSYLPEYVLTNEALEKKVDTSSDWILSRVGIERRHIAKDGEMASGMATEAARAALESAQLTPADIDLIIVATSTPDYIFPSTACIVQANLGIKNCPAFDISVACAGFIYAMYLAEQCIKTGQAKHALVIGSEVMSRLLDWTDRTTCVLFGDGAGAAVLSATDQPGIISSHVDADGRHKDMLCVPNILPGQHSDKSHAYINMHGKEVFKIAVSTLEKLVLKTLAENHINQSEINWLIPHQANRRIIEAMAKRLSMSMDQVILTLPDQGNTSCASIPIALDVAVRDGRIQRGDLLLLETFGGGLAWGAALVRY